MVNGRVSEGGLRWLGMLGLDEKVAERPQGTPLRMAGSVGRLSLLFYFVGVLVVAESAHVGFVVQQVA